MASQKTFACMMTKKHRILVDLTPRYWALGVGVGRIRSHFQLGPLAFCVCKVRD
ncbi:hypothetical protein JI721_15725 [Alicyclobacillus cycloheptanicus]|uniref:Uncharacterized protein n=1 Tax=Alicyclobacillus cycloheptanicus TaxID=1457 RepID=A0ABT9XE86_9BACL|nr:hypothetical protein [Alicyclobacillus cycloheptanicus]MDQ0188389.1 hypothetical protein [Alicyclobacillus cycloheptanicus]WDM01095.1 hypothetical protein JI721_15725 [Alicyclobacillus cycloheptanicus]